MNEDLRDLLVNTSAIAALVATRIYWDVIAQGATSPSVVLYLISTVPGHHFQGPDPLTPSRVQIDVRALTATSRWEVARAIKTCLDGYRGTAANTEFQGIFLQSERQRYARPANGAEAFFLASMDFEIWSKPTS